MNHLINWAGAALIALVLSTSYMLDGASDIEAAQATQDSAQDAINSVAASARIERAEAQINAQLFATSNP